MQDSTDFSATDLTISGMADEGVRIDTNSTVTLLHNLTVTNSGLAGIYINGTTGTISGADVSNSGTSVSSYNAGQANADQRPLCRRPGRGGQRNVRRQPGLGHLPVRPGRGHRHRQHDLRQPMAWTSTATAATR